MNIECPVSLGELVDKISILEIKKSKISDAQKLIHIENERELLGQKLENLHLSQIDAYKNELKQINLKLWNIEDEIRIKEKQKQFDSEFIELARQVYITNDQRFAVKNKINEHFQSGVKEVKSYEDYK